MATRTARRSALLVQTFSLWTCMARAATFVTCWRQRPVCCWTDCCLRTSAHRSAAVPPCPLRHLLRPETDNMGSNNTGPGQAAQLQLQQHCSGSLTLACPLTHPSYARTLIALYCLLAATQVEKPVLADSARGACPPRLTRRQGTTLSATFALSFVGTLARATPTLQHLAATLPHTALLDGAAVARIRRQRCQPPVQAQSYW